MVRRMPAATYPPNLVDGKEDVKLAKNDGRLAVTTEMLLHSTETAGKLPPSLQKTAILADRYQGCELR